MTIPDLRIVCCRCGHCKRLAPTWEELGKKFLNRKEVSIMKVDCTLEDNKQLCSDQEVRNRYKLSIV